MAFTILSEQSAYTQPPPRNQREIQIDSLFRAGDYLSIIESSTSYLSDARAANDSVQIGRMLTSLGRGEVMLGRVAGIEKLDLSILVSQSVRDTVNWMRALGYRSLVYSYQGRYDDAANMNRERLDLALLTGDRASEAWARTMLGYVALLRDELETARSEYSVAVDLFFGMELRAEALTPLVGLGRVYNSMGDVENARRCYLRVLDTSREVGDRVNEGHALNNLGTLEYLFGDITLSAQYFEKSMDLAEETGNVRGTITPATNIALAMQYLGRYDDADAILNRALESSEDADLGDLVPMILNRLAQNRTRQGRFNAAVGIYNRLLEFEGTIPKKVHDEAVYGMAFSLAWLDKPQAALDVIDGRIDWPPVRELEYPVSWLKAKCYLALEQPAEALEWAVAADRFVSDLEVSRSGWVVARITSQCYRDMGRTDEAVVWFDKMLERFDSLRTSFSDPVWREQAIGVFSLIDGCGVLLERPDMSPGEKREQLFNLVQRFKMRTLFDRITEPRQRTESATRLAALPPIDLRTLQQLVLEPGELFLDFAVGSRTGYLFAVTRDSLRVVEIPGINSELENKVTLYRQLVVGETDARGAPDIGLISAEMGAAVLGGVTDLVGSATRLLVSPMMYYSGIPFVELVVEGDETGSRALIETHEIQMVPSATVLSWLRSLDQRDVADRPEISIVAVTPTSGGQLTGARREVDRLANRYRDVMETSNLAGFEMAESSRSVGVVHVAAHFEIDDENPWFSGILLGDPDAGGEFRADPYVRAGDIANRRIPVDLAVLSGCESAVVRSDIGSEGVAGLTSAFLSAGARSVVATLWRVDDAVTADLMRHFYDGLAEGLTVVEALRAAQLLVRAEPDTRAPFYWAGFVVVGDGGVQVNLETRNKWVGGGVLIAACCLVFIGLLVLIGLRFRKSN